MDAAHEKTAWVLPAPQAAQETTQSNRIITIAEKKGNPTAILIARLGLAGHTVAHGTNKDFFVGKWGLIRHCPDYAALENFARIVGVLP